MNSWACSCKPFAVHSVVVASLLIITCNLVKVMLSVSRSFSFYIKYSVKFRIVTTMWWIPNLSSALLGNFLLIWYCWPEAYWVILLGLASVRYNLDMWRLTDLCASCLYGCSVLQLSSLSVIGCWGYDVHFCWSSWGTGLTDWWQRTC